MNLGIAGRIAIIGGSSKGLGHASARALARDGVHVVLNARGEAALAKAADDIRAESPSVRVTTVPGSMTDPAVREALVAAAGGAPDIVVNNAGGPPPGDFRDWRREDWIAAFDSNCLAATEMMRLTIDGMAERGFGRIVNITSSSARVPIQSLGLSNAARAALVNFSIGLAPQVSARGVTINNILPGPFATDRMKQIAQIPAEEYNPVAKRFGDPDELAAACAFLCSAHAGYITGQNLMMDGGLYSGNF